MSQKRANCERVNYAENARLKLTFIKGILNPFYTA